MSINPVEVRMIDIGWLYANEKNFLDFAQILYENGQNSVYETEFVKTLLEVFWKRN